MVTFDTRTVQIMLAPLHTLYENVITPTGYPDWGFVEK